MQREFKILSLRHNKTGFNMFNEYIIYMVYLFALLALLFSSVCISDAVLLLLKHLGYPQEMKIRWYLTWVIFTVFFQTGLLSYIFYRVFFR